MIGRITQMDSWEIEKENQRTIEHLKKLKSKNKVSLKIDEIINYHKERIKKMRKIRKATICVNCDSIRTERIKSGGWKCLYCGVKFGQPLNSI